jgi:glycosyltransferase involved in cell wall biosynthesis|tara:strand:- start:2945 stop:3649 length:705 start_codon:yes stop_codon:yes gene_type:complete
MSNTKLSIIIPSYNEQKTIIQTLERINETKSTYADYEIIVINDGSTDGTSNLLKSNSKLYNHLIDYEKNFGKGYAVKKGLSIATGDYIIFQDADLEYDPKDFSKFIYLINKFNADAIIGSRFSYSDFTRSHSFFNKIGNHVLTFIFNLLYNTTFTDIYSCYFCFKANLVNSEKLQTLGFEQHAEILCKAIKKGKFFYEVPINYNGRTQSEGKKIKYYHFFIVLFRIILQRIIKE